MRKTFMGMPGDKEKLHKIIKILCLEASVCKVGDIVTPDSVSHQVFIL